MHISGTEMHFKISYHYITQTETEAEFDQSFFRWKLC